MKMMMEICEGLKNDEMGGTVGEGRRRRWTRQEGLSLPEQQPVHHRNEKTGNNKKKERVRTSHKQREKRRDDGYPFLTFNSHRVCHS